MHVFDNLKVGIPELYEPETVLGIGPSFGQDESEKVGYTVPTQLAG